MTAEIKTIAAVLFVSLIAGTASYSGEVEERFDKASRLLDSRRFPEAIAVFKQTIDLQRDNPDAWSYLGQAYFGAGKCQDGLNAQEEAIHLMPAKAHYWIGKGNCLLCLGRSDDALKAYEKAIALNSTQESSWYGAARCYALKVEKENALKHLSRAIELNPRIKGLAYRDASFRNVSNDPEFQKLIEP